MKNKPRVSLIVPTYNREQPLIETLNSLFMLDYPAAEWELLVIDQTPLHEVETQRFLEAQEKAGKIRWFRPPEITFASLTKARNFGMMKSNSPDFYLFVDDDVEVKPDFIHCHLKAYTDLAVAATVGRVTIPGHSYPAPPFQVGKISWWGRFIDNFHGDQAIDSDNFIGCNFSLRAAVVPKIGGFDQEFIGNAMREDSDMALRVREIGQRIRFMPEADLLHKQVISGGTRTAARSDWYYALFYNNFLFYSKHAPAWRRPFFILQMWRPILACWLFYGKGSFEAFLRPWQGIAGGIKAAERSRKFGLSVPSQPVINQIF